MPDDKRAEIIDLLIRNRVSTTEVADCLGKSGALKGIMPINRGFHKVGEVRLICAFDESNWSLHEQIADIEEGKIIFVKAVNCGDRALFGELVSKYLLLYRRSVALVVDGHTRDAAALLKENYPIWHRGFNPEGCYNTRTTGDHEHIEEMKREFDGSVMVCDDCGVVMIPRGELGDEMLEHLRSIELQEDIWFDRLDRYKENTFDIVCLKKYLGGDTND